VTAGRKLVQQAMLPDALLGSMLACGQPHSSFAETDRGGDERELVAIDGLWGA
jgi:hypothetical protein